MRKLPKYVAMAALSMAAAAALPASLQAQDRDRDRNRGDSTDIVQRAEDLPDDVRRTIEREAVGTNHFIDRRVRDEKVRYIVHYTAPDGKRMRIRVDDRGELVEEPNAALVQPEPGLEEEHERDEADRSVRYTTIEEDELPDRVRRTMDKFREGTHDPLFRRQERGGKTFYSVHYTTPQSERMWVRVAENGEVAEGPHINIGKGIGLNVASGRDRDRDRDDARADRRGDRREDRADRRADRTERRGEEMRRAEIGADEVPASVRRAIEQETAGGTEHRFFRETQGGQRTYYVEYATRNGERVHLRLDEDGQVLKEQTVAGAPQRTAEEMRAQELTADQVPAEVRRTIERETAGGTEHRFYRDPQNGEITYFVEYTKDGQRGNLRVDERGKVLGETEVAAGTPRPAQPAPVPQSGDDAELTGDTGPAGSHVLIGVGDLPAEVRRAFEQATQGGTEHIVQRHTQDGRTLYTAHYRTAEDDHNFLVVDDRGQVVVEPRKSRWLEAAKGVRFEPLTVDKLPAEVRQAIEKQAPRASEHLIVRRVRPEGEPTYLVQFTNAKGRRQQLEVNENGKVRNEVGAAQENPFRLADRKGDRDERRSERQ